MTEHTTIVLNKYVQVKRNEYRLTIEKETFYETQQGSKQTSLYRAILSDINSDFTTWCLFTDRLIKDSNVLTNWIVDQDGINDPESRFIEHIKRWDGVVK